MSRPTGTSRRASNPEKVPCRQPEIHIVHMLWTGAVGCGGCSVYLSTSLSPSRHVTRRNTGTCGIVRRTRCSPCGFAVPAGTPSFGKGLRGRDESGSKGEGPAPRVPVLLILVASRLDPGEASRVLRPLRSGASESSAKGRSATRSDSQRPHRRTRWDGHPAWGSLPKPCLALPSATPGGGREKNGGPRGLDFGKSVCGTAA